MRVCNCGQLQLLVSLLLIDDCAHVWIMSKRNSTWYDGGACFRVVRTEPLSITEKHVTCHEQCDLRNEVKKHRYRCKYTKTA